MHWGSKTETFSPVEPGQTEPEGRQLRLMGRVPTIALIQSVLAIAGPVADLVLRVAVLVQTWE